ncbi:uncharacterized protein MONBRDRAFT_32970 [Monosiga brevicollis MX1]|uniref:Protein kinase domain-containing protein n=1 Tax=Monosiga brevicollis TaxID=81824 RepID=A9V2S8_MONBE|nr:uncharacterized protein MONBRDRAFT_32970 [Monosiga brevicollis MX1]EDQ88066.1 predicted protein [Monosiga brevicollis MX1]|eukprot:XP_001747142.1 hypothetical protein [Monosiga brevicollis MX1]
MAVPTELLNKRYLLGAELGHGATATVHRALDIATTGTVAVKLVASHRYAEAMTEIQMMQLLAHAQNIVRLEDTFALSDGRTAIVMRDMPRGTLYHHICPHAPVSLSQANAHRWLRQLVHAAQEVAIAGFVHGDIKPENCLMDEHNNLVLHDLGTMVPIGHQHGQQIPGTQMYMAPEILRGHPCHTGQDVWSIGLVLYAMLFADLPWDRASRRDQQFRDYFAQGVLPVQARLELLTPAMRHVLLRMLNPVPEMRATLDEVAFFLDANFPWFVSLKEPEKTSQKHHQRQSRHHRHEHQRQHTAPSSILPDIKLASSAGGCATPKSHRAGFLDPTVIQSKVSGDSAISSDSDMTDGHRKRSVTPGRANLDRLAAQYIC